MTNWNDGAIVDVVARPRFRRETTPQWLAAACTLLGYRPPPLDKTFRYADFGCGAGFTAIAVAAAFPQAEVWGFDINPANIELARSLAAQGGLSNIRFQETSLAALATAPPGDALPFDFIVAESLLSILSPGNQAHVYTLIERHLRPGGLAYLGYDTATGWTEAAPVVTLMRKLYEMGTDTSDFAIPDILAWLERLKAGGAYYFQRNPAFDRHVTAFHAAPADELALTLLNRDWNALMFADVATAMAEARCDFIGRATLHENIAWAASPPGMIAMLDEAPGLRIKETMQDIAARTAYRRDIYRRGLTSMPVAEHRACLDALTVAALSFDELPLPAWNGTIPADPELYGPLTAALRQGPLSIATANTIGPLADCPIEEAANAIAMLLAAGLAYPVLPRNVAREAAAGVARLNDALIDAATRGEEIGYLVSPLLGAAIEVTALEALTIGALTYGHRDNDPDHLIVAVLQAMRRGGRSVTQDGMPVEDETAAIQSLATTIAGIVARRVPLFRALGILPG